MNGDGRTINASDSLNSEERYDGVQPNGVQSDDDDQSYINPSRPGTDKNQPEEGKLNGGKLHESTVPKGTPFKRRKLNQHLYVDYFLNNHRSLLPLFPSAKSKEISETMGAVNCLYYRLKVNRSCKETICYVLGDGTAPRTGATFAISSSFTVFSIDPALKSKFHKTSEGVAFKDHRIRIEKNEYLERIKSCKCKSEEFMDIVQNARLSIIVAVHSHADLKEFWDRVPSPKIAIAIPCCVPQITSIEPTDSYIDEKIYGMMNKVVYWDTR